MTESAGTPLAPQWHVIERVTSAEIFAEIVDGGAATDVFTTATTAVPHHRLPHQIQRTIRAALTVGMTEVAAPANASTGR